MHLNIEPKEVRSPFNPDEVLDTATCLKLTIRYIVGEAKAKCHFQLKNTDMNIVPYGEGNLEIVTDDWAADDDLMITRAADVLGVTVITE